MCELRDGIRNYQNILYFSVFYLWQCGIFTVHICDGVTLTNSASEVRQLKAKEAPNSDLPCAVGEVARQTCLSHHIGPKHWNGKSVRDVTG